MDSEVYFTLKKFNKQLKVRKISLLDIVKMFYIMRIIVRYCVYSSRLVAEVHFQVK